MNVACLVSGGKDSLYACYLAMQKGWNVTHLVGLVSENPASFMFQFVDETHFKKLSAVTGIPVIVEHTSGEENEELKDLKRALEKISVDAVVSGAVLSDYQRHRIDMVCEELGLRSFAPLWRKDGEMLLAEMIDAGFRAKIVSTAAEGLNPSHIGRVLDADLFEELRRLKGKYGIHVMGEGGEYETLVGDAPLFKKPI